MHRPIKYVEKVVSMAANGAWHIFERLNRISPNPTFTPAWSDKPLLKSWQKTKPTLEMAAHDRLAVPKMYSRGAG